MVTADRMQQRRRLRIRVGYASSPNALDRRLGRPRSPGGLRRGRVRPRASRVSSSRSSRSRILDVAHTLPSRSSPSPRRPASAWSSRRLASVAGALVALHDCTTDDFLHREIPSASARVGKASSSRHPSSKCQRHETMVSIRYHALNEDLTKR